MTNKDWFWVALFIVTVLSIYAFGFIMMARGG